MVNLKVGADKRLYVRESQLGLGQVRKDLSM